MIMIESKNEMKIKIQFLSNRIEVTSHLLSLNHDYYHNQWRKSKSIIIIKCNKHKNKIAWESLRNKKTKKLLILFAKVMIMMMKLAIIFHHLDDWSYDDNDDYTMFIIIIIIYVIYIQISKYAMSQDHKNNNYIHFS